MDHRRRFSAFVTKDSKATPAIRHALQLAREFLSVHQFEARLQIKLAIIVEELVTNAFKHGGKDQDISLSLELTADSEIIRLTMKDTGKPFNPLAHPPVTRPDPKTGGGIGLAIVHAWGHDAYYSREGNENKLSLNLR